VRPVQFSAVNINQENHVEDQKLEEGCQEIAVENAQAKESRQAGEEGTLIRAVTLMQRSSKPLHEKPRGREIYCERETR
jgi:hypothetical protein